MGRQIADPYAVPDDFDQFFAEYFGFGWSYTCQLAGDSLDTDQKTDCVDDALQKAFNNRRSFEPERGTQFKTYFAAILRNCVMDAFRKRRQELSQLPEGFDAEDRSAERARFDLEARWFWAVFDDFPPLTKQVFWLRHCLIDLRDPTEPIDDHEIKAFLSRLEYLPTSQPSWAEVARLLGETKNTVLAAHRRGERRLEKKLGTLAKDLQR